MRPSTLRVAVARAPAEGSGMKVALAKVSSTWKMSSPFRSLKSSAPRWVKTNRAVRATKCVPSTSPPEVPEPWVECRRVLSDNAKCQPSKTLTALCRRSQDLRKSFTKPYTLQTNGKAGWAIRSRLEPMKRVARMIKKHWVGVINAATSDVTNARAKG